jgi:hypothetical protein
MNPNREPGEEWLPLGRQCYRFEPPDIYFVRSRGAVTGEEMRLMLDTVVELAERAGRRVFWLCDISGLTSVTPEARKVGVEYGNASDSVEATIILGASFHQRVLANFSIKAEKMLRPSRKNAPTVVFVATEGEARALVEEIRRKSRPR